MDVEGLQLGMPLSEMLLRYPALKPAPDDTLHKLGIQQFAGAYLRSDHEVTVRVRDGKVVASDIARSGLRAEQAERERELQARNLAARLRLQERMRALANLESSRTEDDVMLVRWAGEEDSSRRLARFMTTGAGPDEWHAIASTWNWDNGIEPLFWIIRRPECDKATALQAFWLAEPIWFERYAGDVSKVPGHSLGTFYFVTEIFERWTWGFYYRNKIAYTPSPELPSQVVNRLGILSSVPSSMGAALQGCSIALEDYAEGVPSFLWDPGEIV